MRRLLRRRARQSDKNEAPPAFAGADWADSEDEAEYEELPIEPFVPVSGGDEDDEDYDTYEAEAADLPAAPRRRRSLPRARLPRVDLGIVFRLDVLLLALFLIAAGIFGTLLYQDRLQDDIVAWWPVAIIAGGALWMVLMLVRRQVAPFLGGSAFAGVGLSLLLNSQDIAAFEETVLGVVLVTVGLGIVVRGLLLRQRVPL